jgi:hypothetical protein
MRDDDLVRSDVDKPDNTSTRPDSTSKPDGRDIKPELRDTKWRLLSDAKSEDGPCAESEFSRLVDEGPESEELE